MAELKKGFLINFSYMITNQTKLIFILQTFFPQKIFKWCWGWEIFSQIKIYEVLVLISFSNRNFLHKFEFFNRSILWFQFSWYSFYLYRFINCLVPLFHFYANDKTYAQYNCSYVSSLHRQQCWYQIKFISVQFNMC